MELSSDHIKNNYKQCYVSIFIPNVIAKMFLRKIYFMQKVSFSLFPRLAMTMGDPVEHATGLEKRELLAQLAGNKNIWSTGMKRGPGTRDNPNEIPSAFESRIVGCICHPHACSVSYMWLHKDQPKRCECGFWFKLVYEAPV